MTLAEKGVTDIEKEVAQQEGGEPHQESRVGPHVPAQQLQMSQGSQDGIGVQ